MFQQITQCEICGETKIFKEAGVGRNGKPFKAFYSCPNWKREDHKQVKASPAAFKSPTTLPNKASGEMLLLEELNALNKRFDKLAKYLVSKLGKAGVEQVTTNVEDIEF